MRGIIAILRRSEVAPPTLCRPEVAPPTLCRSGVAPPTLCRSGVEPPTGKLHPRQISVRSSKFGKSSPRNELPIGSCCLSVVPLLSRGWIVPVGGSTPDRLRIIAILRGRGLPLRLCAGRGLPLRLCAGRGLNPRPESSTPAKYPSAIPNPESHLPEMNFQLVLVVCPLFPCFRVDGSFRSGVQPPTGSEL